MKSVRSKSLVAATACFISIGVTSMLAPTGAHAEPSTKAKCVFVAGTGTARDEISQLKCMQNDNSGFAFWYYGATSLMFFDTEIASNGGSTTSGDKWYFDPSVVSFTDIKKELQREYGYTNVTYGGHESGTTGDVINANYDSPSKSKH